jgi:hypothetical protein
MFNSICDWLEVVENVLPKPGDSTQLEHWLESAEDLANVYIHDALKYQVIEKILEVYERKLRNALVTTHKELCDTDILYSSNDNIDEILNSLCTRPQIAQRTEEWYNQMRNVLSASELDDIFGSPRARAQLIMNKINPQPRPMQSLAVASSRMSPFDWGIRFEPVVKQIYEHMYNSTIKELGRLTSLQDSRLTASPDGLVMTGIRKGRLIEIKCPVTREPDGKISKKYYNQMQSQLFVTGLQVCDFVEAVFISPYSSVLNREGPSKYYGEIALIESIYDDLPVPSYRYEYSPLNYTENAVYNFDLKENETIIERIPWRLYSWHEQIVQANPHWWNNIKPAIDVFWTDVEKARLGNFVMPEGKKREKKEEKCLIIVNRLES